MPILQVERWASRAKRNKIRNLAFLVLGKIGHIGQKRIKTENLGIFGPRQNWAFWAYFLSIFQVKRWGLCISYLAYWAYWAFLRLRPRPCRNHICCARCRWGMEADVAMREASADGPAGDRIQAGIACAC